MFFTFHNSSAKTFIILYPVGWFCNMFTKIQNVQVIIDISVDVCMLSLPPWSIRRIIDPIHGPVAILHRFSCHRIYCTLSLYRSVRHLSTPNGTRNILPHMITAWRNTLLDKQKQCLRLIKSTRTQDQRVHRLMHQHMVNVRKQS